MLAAPLAPSEARPNSWDPSVSRLTSVLAKWISSEEQSIQSISGRGGDGGVEEGGAMTNEFIQARTVVFVCVPAPETSNNLKQRLWS